MAMGSNCEQCGATPPVLQSGEFAGTQDIHNYCELCSKDLCNKCLVSGTCPESKDEKHKPALED